MTVLHLVLTLFAFGLAIGATVFAYGLYLHRLDVQDRRGWRRSHL